MINNQFILTFPDSWKDNTVYSFAGTYEYGMSHTLLVNVIPNISEGVLVKSYAKSQLDISLQELSRFELLGEFETIHPIVRVPQYAVTFRFSPFEDQLVYQKQYFLIVQTKAYVFTGSFSQASFQYMAPVTDKIVASFQIPMQR